jgi:prevent-host-death family protein
VARQVNLAEAKTHLSRLIEAVEAGEEVVIAKGGKPVAKLSPIRHAGRRRKLGLLDGKLKIPDDFNAPLPDEILPDFGAAAGGLSSGDVAYSQPPRTIRKRLRPRTR